MRLVVMTYNLLYAFHEREEGRTMRARPERAVAASTVVRREAPDLLALTEAAYCAHHGRFIRPDYESLFGLPHVVSAGLEGDWGHCLASRFPILSVETVPIGENPNGVMTSALRAVVDCDGRALTVAVAHPSPHVTEAERLAGMEPLLASLVRPCILTGDFNALSDEDPYTFEGLVEDMRPYEKEPERIARLMLDRQLVRRVRESGLVDTLPRDRRTHTIPTALARPATQGARLRIDYIFASPELSAVGSEVVTGAPVDDASDHRPLVATLDW